MVLLQWRVAAVILIQCGYLLTEIRPSLHSFGDVAYMYVDAAAS